MSKVDLSVKIGSLTLRNPIMLASGTVGYGNEMAEFTDLNKLGGIVTKSLSLKPRKGNPPQRIVETPAGMLNAIGLANVGVEVFLKEKIPFLKQFDVPLICNIAASTIEEYVECTKILTDEETIKAFEINISCPNVREGGLLFGNDLNSVARITEKAGHRPALRLSRRHRHGHHPGNQWPHREPARPGRGHPPDRPGRELSDHGREQHRARQHDRDAERGHRGNGGMMRSLASRLNAAHREGGAALLIVLGVGMLMLLIVAGGLTVASGGLQKTDRDQDFNGALDAAFAGVEEYQSRLASDAAYYRYGNPDALFSKSPISNSSVTLPTGTATNPAFGIGTSGTWATVPGSSPVASFRYEVDNSQYASTGAIRIRSTGMVGTVTRSIVADLRQSGFIDFLYFTDYEVQDPELTGLAYCETHIWEGRSNNCANIRFGTSDVIDGPLHSNDTLTICASVFNGRVTTSNPNSPIFIRPNGCGNATYAVGTGPTYQAPLSMPPTNAELKKETRNDLTASEVPIPGCLYTGPTVITFTADGRMNVKSPWTIRTQVSQTSGIASAAPAMCGTPGTGTGALGSLTGATIDVPPSNVIYVQNVPTITTDPNYRAGTPSNFGCVNSNTGWTFGTTRFPATNEITPSGSTSSNPAYGCRNGDVYVQGTFNGAATIGAENYIYVTGNLTYADANNDILGLVGNGAVWVWNPMRNTNNGERPLLTDSGRTIDAAILSVAHTFQVQNFNRGSTSRGTLTVNGSIAQKFRGPVGLTNGVGYDKDYRYDTRLAYLAPPKYLSPVSSSYGVTQYATVPAAFTSTGATP